MVETQKPKEVMDMNMRERGELAEALIELLATHDELRAAVMECACHCPNIVVEY